MNVNWNEIILLNSCVALGLAPNSLRLVQEILNDDFDTSGRLSNWVMQTFKSNFWVHDKFGFVLNFVLHLPNLAFEDDEIARSPQNCAKCSFVPNLLQIVVWLKDFVQLDEFQWGKVLSAQSNSEQISDFSMFWVSLVSLIAIDHFK